MQNFKMRTRMWSRKLCLVVAITLIFTMFTACGTEEETLDPANPVTVVVWHHFSGAVQSAFETAIREFNETVGMDRGIFVQGYSAGTVSELAAAVRASIAGEVGSEKLPHIFTAFADTAYVAKQYGLLVDFQDYLSEAQQQEFFASFINGGRIGRNNELFLFPVAVATEIFMLNHTDWAPFASENNFSYGDLATMEDIKRVAQVYYDWSGGKAFFGRDQFANLFIIGSKQFGVELFDVDSAGQVTLNLDEQVMRRIWDYYYIPHIRGYFTAYSRFRSDDLRVGDILAYSGSTVSAAFFPDEIRVEGESRPIDVKVLPMPVFQGGERVLVRQGANMVITQTTEAEQYASKVFVHWFTDPQQNISFAALSGHMPVRTAAMDYELIRATADEFDIVLTDATDQALRIAISEVKESTMYSMPAFQTATAARGVLYSHLRNKAIEDRATIVEMMANGVDREEAIAYFATDEKFRAWLADFEAELRAVIGN